MQLRNASRRSIGRRLALFALSAFALVALTQCRYVNDNITGVNVTRGTISARTSCAKKCEDSYKAASKVEEKRHHDALKACGSHDSACKKSEDAKHKNILDTLKRQRQACKASCYNEGGGQGGA